MSTSTERIFVYGTLQRGEARSCYMQGCRLTGTMNVPGRLYDTGRGYPAAVFDPESPSSVTGELYAAENAGEKIAELDVVEGTDSGLFRRVAVSHGGLRLHCYEPGPLLDGCVRGDNLISSGSWRRYSSLALNDPVDFALRFEDHIKNTYREPQDAFSDGIVFHEGDIPVLVTAPHATGHMRMEKYKRHEPYTGALAVMLHALTGSHALYTDRLSPSDPNFYDDNPFKSRLAEITEKYGIELVIDLHGTGTERPDEVFPGMGSAGEFLLGEESYIRGLESASGFHGVALGSSGVFPASRQMTVAKYAALRLRVPSIQLEIIRALRQPDKDPGRFVKLVRFLTGFIKGLH